MAHFYRSCNISYNSNWPKWFGDGHIKSEGKLPTGTPHVMFLWSSSLHPKLDFDALSHVCTKEPRDRATDIHATKTSTAIWFSSALEVFLKKWYALYKFTFYFYFFIYHVSFNRCSLETRQRSSNKLKVVACHQHHGVLGPHFKNEYYQQLLTLWYLVIT